MTPAGHTETVVGDAISTALTPDPELFLDTWSEEHVVLPKGSAFSGPYRLSHTPYARRILQCLSPSHPATRVVVKAASQMLKTQVFINAALGWIDRAPANILALEPTDKLAKRLSSRMSKAIEACDTVRAKVAQPRSRDARNTVDTKEFDGGALHIVTSGSASNLAEITARYVFSDEVDRMQINLDGEGDPVEIVEARTTQFEGISKAYHVSSPTLMGLSKIDSLYFQGTQESYHISCPDCGHLHELVQENFAYSYDEGSDVVDRAWFKCPACFFEIEEHHKSSILPSVDDGGEARWVAKSQGDGETISVTISAFYAPPGSITWLRLARQHARALIRQKRGDPAAMQVYYNTRLGLSYDASESSTTIDHLRSRAESYAPRTMPDGALVLTTFVDTQPTRLELVTQAWGPGLEGWIVDHEIFWGSPADPPAQPGSVWQRLDEYRRTPLAHASGVPVQISAYGIDTGGANTQDVYNYASGRDHWSCVATKGHSLRGKPVIAGAPTKIDVDWRGVRIDEGVKLWMLGTDTAKDHIFNRIHLASGPGSIHFHKGLESEFYEQLLAERPVTRWSKGRPIREWVKPNGARNEVLDCMVGNLAMAYFLGLHKWSPLDWARLRTKLIPAQLTPDMFVQAPAQAEPTPTPTPSAALDVETPKAVIPAAVSIPIAPDPLVAPTVYPAAPPPVPSPANPGRRQINRGIY